ncbi:hypothetical protein BGZ65_001044, partial [Modicella reniformis]
QSVVKTPSTAGVRAGVQYSRDFPANSDWGSTGEGGWKNIDIQASYTWQESSSGDALFSVVNSQGANILVHAYVNSGVAGVQFGTLDSNSMLQQGTQWPV